MRARRRVVIAAIALALTAPLTLALIVISRHLTTASSDWRVTASDTSALPAGGEFRHVKFVGPTGSFEAFCATWPANAIRVRLVDLSTRTQPPLRKILDEQKALAVLNGGYFDDAFRPVGLLRINGNEISPFADRSPLSGGLNIDGNGRLRISEAKDFDIANTPSAVQSGPFLIDPGGRLGIRSSTGTPADRTVVATDGNRICLLVTTPVDLLDLARCLSGHAAAFGLNSVDRALNLDGGPSTGFAFRLADDVLARQPRGPVRDVIVVEPQ